MIGVDARRSYDAVAARYQTEVGAELPGKPLDRALLNTVVELSDEGWILDVGGGPGHVAAHLSNHAAQVLGSDLSPAMAEIAAHDGRFPVVVADMTKLPIADACLGAIVCFYAVIHLDEDGRAAAYSEFARALRPGGVALLAFHVSDADAAPGDIRVLTDWWETPVDLIFHFLDPAAEIALATAAGLQLSARIDREPVPGVEHASRRGYLLLAKS